ncbi:MAG: HD domain-containing protein [Chloroflexaceae bacterium]
MSNDPDLAGAQAYAFMCLERELPPQLSYHSLAHTRDDVFPAVTRLADSIGITGEDRLLLQTAACYHDIGFVIQREAHEMVSVQIARDILPSFGYNPAQLALISGMIMATRLPQSPQTLLEQMLADADLDNLGRADFFCRSQALRAELAAYGTVCSPNDWYERQILFLRQHCYFTPAARRLRDAGKQFNIIALRLLRASM